MFKAQNTQMLTYLPISIGHNFIKFCFFLILLFLAACGDTKNEKSTENKARTEKTEETPAPKGNSKTILCFGDSITAGLGLDDINDAYIGVLQQKIDSLSLGYTVINSGVSGETTAGGKSRIEWVIKQNPSIFLLELGANDGLRGVSLSETRSNLESIIAVVREKSPKTIIVLAGMQLPPNMGQEYTAEFKQLYIDLAKEKNLEFIPFILQDVGGIASLNQSDGIHPNIEGHKIVANTVWQVLKPLLSSKF